MIRALTIAQMNAATPRLNGNAILKNLRNGERCTVRIVNPGTYHHSDFEPATRVDAVTLLRWAGGIWSWNPVPCTLSWGNNVTACSIHLMPHAHHLYGRFSFNVMNDSALRLNAQGSHFCLHYVNTMEVRFRSNQTSRDWWQRMNNAVHDAVKLANAHIVPQPPPNPQSGWVQSGSNWFFYRNNNRATGWEFINNVWYFFNQQGVMQTGWVFHNDKWYFLHASGAMATGWVNDGGTWYFMDSDGAMKTGWINVNDTWYFMNPSGAMQTGWLLHNNNWYYLQSNGAMATGAITINGVRHSFDSSGVWIP